LNLHPLTLRAIPPIRFFPPTSNWPASLRPSFFACVSSHRISERAVFILVFHDSLPLCPPLKKGPFFLFFPSLRLSKQQTRLRYRFPPLFLSSFSENAPLGFVPDLFQKDFLAPPYWVSELLDTPPPPWPLPPHCPVKTVIFFFSFFFFYRSPY